MLQTRFKKRLSASELMEKNDLPFGLEFFDFFLREIYQLFQKTLKYLLGSSNHHFEWLLLAQTPKNFWEFKIEKFLRNLKMEESVRMRLRDSE